MDTSPPPERTGRLMLDFSQPMRPKDLRRVKITPSREKPLGGSPFAFPDRRELYELMPTEDR